MNNQPQQVQEEMIEKLASIEPADDYDGVVSFWGDDDADERVCPHCVKKYFIKEQVSRSWDVAVKENDLYD